MKTPRAFSATLFAAGLLALSGATTARARPLDKLTYHNDAARPGWNPHETQLTAATLS